MATGRDVQLTRQFGKYLVCAELGRRGWIASTFAGSIPGFDILAVNPDSRMLEVQVKAIRSASWQLNAGQFIDVEIRDGEQFVRGKRAMRRPPGSASSWSSRGTGHDECYVFPWDLHDILLQDYKAGARPKNPDTLHHALYPKRIERFKDNWMAIGRPPKPPTVIDWAAQGV